MSPENINENKKALQESRLNGQSDAFFSRPEKSLPEPPKSASPQKALHESRLKDQNQENQKTSKVNQHPNSSKKNALIQSRLNDKNALAQKAAQIGQRYGVSGAGALNPQAAATIAIGEASSLSKYIDSGWDWLFGIALIFALLKDISDIFLIGSLPLIGSIITFMASFIIAMVMLLVGGSNKGKAVRGAMKKFYTLIAGTGIEMFFGINFFPVETAIVVAVYYFVLDERRMEEEEEIAKNKQQKARLEMERAMNENVSQEKQEPSYA